MNTRRSKSRAEKSGFAVVMAMLVILALFVALLAANTATLNHLDREVRGLEKHQMDRLNLPSSVNKHSAATNSPAAR